MLYVQITDRHPNGAPKTAHVVDSRNTNGWDDYETRNNWKTFGEADAVAMALGAEYIATDAGAHCHPRYDVIKLPKVGDKVSYAFNGDYYPCGLITKVSTGPNFKRITTSTGKVFYRRRLTGSWMMDRTWSLVSGHVEKRNPEF